MLRQSLSTKNGSLKAKVWWWWQNYDSNLIGERLYISFYRSVTRFFLLFHSHQATSLKPSRVSSPSQPLFHPAYLQYITLFISLNLCFIRIAFEICLICSHSSFSRLFFACSSWWPTSTIFLPLKFIIHIKLRPSNPHVSCHRHRFAYFGRTRHSCAGFLLNHPGGLLKQSLLDLVALIILILVLFLLVLVV